MQPFARTLTSRLLNRVIELNTLAPNLFLWAFCLILPFCLAVQMSPIITNESTTKGFPLLPAAQLN